jgi:Ca2+-binding EF-hand superfamily protein
LKIKECPSGIVNEQAFKEVYAQFFPQGDCANYAHYVFTTIDQNCDGIVNFEDFLLGLSILSRGSVDEKLRWIFNLYDINRDGKITKDELEQIVTSVYDLMGKYTDPPANDSNCKNHVDYVFKVFNYIILKKYENSYFFLIENQ